MRQQELVWIKIPFSDFSQTKIRPALVVSNNDYNSKCEDMVICAVTSNLQRAVFSVSLEQKDLVSGSLPIESRIKADKIMQVDKKLAIRDRKSTRLNSSHSSISYAVFCVKKSKQFGLNIHSGNKDSSGGNILEQINHT